MIPNLRLTPRASPAPRTPTIKSPTKTIREEPQYLSLHKIIGSTVTSNSAVSYVESPRLVAYTAGATAVVVSIDDDSQISQRAFRATSTYGSQGLVNQPHLDSPLASAFSPSQRIIRASATSRDSASAASAFASPSFDSSDSPSGRAAGLKAKSKTASCLALSQDGKWLAMGENGYKPRVLIFSLSKNPASDTPACALAEHTFGVKCLAFSADSQYLASLGDINDGFLYVWNVQPKTGTLLLQASNKCTSNVRAMAWMGNALITVGTRHVKIWRVDKNSEASPTKKFSDATFALTSPSRPLAGRNCILGPLLDKTFTCLVPVDSKRAFICSDEGDVCLLEDDDVSPSFTRVGSAGAPIRSASLIDVTSLLIGGDCGSIKRFDIRDLIDYDRLDSHVADAQELKTPSSSPASITALAPLRNFVLIFTDDRCLSLLTAPHTHSVDNLSEVQEQLPAHHSSIRGIRKASTDAREDAAFFTFSADGLVLLWDEDGRCLERVSVHLEQPSPTPEVPQNEVTAMSWLTSSGEIHYGDQYGYLRTFHVSRGTCTFETKAHAVEITTVDVHQAQSGTYIASGSRDRTIQIFRTQQGHTELMQTLDDHIGGVTDIKFSSDASKLVSCSPDRSILIRSIISGTIDRTERVAYIVSRTITLKATPLALELFHQDQQEILAISAMDKTILQYNLESNETPETFKVGDNDDGELVSLNAVVSVRLPQGRRAVAGIASSDKSVRLYSGAGSLLSRDYGQTEGLTGIITIGKVSNPSDSGLVTVASDGTIFIRKLNCPSDRLPALTYPPDASRGTPKANALSSIKPPLRRVLSSSELMEMQGSSAEVSAIKSNTQNRSPSPKRMQSKSSHANGLESTRPRDTARNNSVADGSNGHSIRAKRGTNIRPPSPSSPRRVQQSKVTSKQIRRQSSQPALSSIYRRKSIGNGSLSPTKPTASGYGANDLLASSQQVCRSLRGYRKSMSTSDEPLPIELVRELERELSLTARALAEKAARSEAVMEKLLDRYGERLVEIMERRIDEKVGKLVEEGVALRKPESSGETSYD